MAATLGGYIITIVGLNESKQIEFGSSTPAASASIVYHLTIDSNTIVDSDIKLKVEELKEELLESTTTTTPLTLPTLTGVLLHNKFQVKYAEKNGDKIQVSDIKPTTTIGGKKKSQHKYSRKR
jgi:isoleucyl-tRNA synthetase